MGIVPKEVLVWSERVFVVAEGDTKFVGYRVLASYDSTVCLLNEHDLGVACKAEEDTTVGLELAGVGGRVLDRYELKGLARVTLRTGIKCLV